MCCQEALRLLEASGTRRVTRARFSGSPIKRIGRDRFVRSYRTATPVARATGYHEMLAHRFGAEGRFLTQAGPNYAIHLWDTEAPPAAAPSKVTAAAAMPKRLAADSAAPSSQTPLRTAR